MMMGCELWSEAVEAMGSVSGTSQEDDRPAGATPIEHLKLNTFLDGHKPNLVCRRIRLGERIQGQHEQCNAKKKQIPHLAHKVLLTERSLTRQKGGSA